MRYILIDLSSDNYLQQPNLFGGYEGEHNETILQVKLPKRMIDIECSGYRFDFQTSEDNKISSPLIPVSELNNDILSFHLTQQLTISGKLLFNVVAILSDENTVSMISKTNTATLRIEDAVDGNIQLIDPNGYKDELQQMIDKRIMEINPAAVDQTYTATSENAQSGLAVAEALASKADITEVDQIKDDLSKFETSEFELLNDIVCDGTFSVITISTFPNGEALKLRKAVIFASVSAETINNDLRVCVNGNSTVFLNARNGVGTSTVNHVFRLESNGIITGENAWGEKQTAVISTGLSLQPILSNNITQLTLICTNNFKSGSIIKIYGVRA